MTQALPPRGRGRPRAGDELDVTRLLAAALDAFAQAGYDGMSVRELSRRLGVSHALLTARFGSKEGLWFAAMEQVLAEVEAFWREAAEAPGLDDLEALRQGLIRGHRDEGVQVRIQPLDALEGRRRQLDR